MEEWKMDIVQRETAVLKKLKQSKTEEELQIKAAKDAICSAEMRISEINKKITTAERGLLYLRNM